MMFSPDEGSWFGGGGDVYIEDSTFTESQFYFDGTLNAVVRNCEFNGLVGMYYHSNGLFAENTATLTDHALYITDASNVNIEDNEITGGDPYCVRISGINTDAYLTGNILASGSTTTLSIGSYASVVGSNNHFLPSNGTYTLTTGGYYGLYPASIDLRNNYWGTDNADQVAEWIWDGSDDENIEMLVDYLPILGGPVPTEDASWSDVKAMYLGGR